MFWALFTPYRKLTALKPFAIFDMDGTLADASARQHHVRGEVKDWETFFSEIDHDPVIQPVADLYRALCESPHYEVAIFTGRPKAHLERTVRWMEKNGLPLRPIYCREDEDERHDLIVKRELYEGLVREGRSVAFVVEDRNAVVKMWRDLGVLCLHCFDADF